MLVKDLGRARGGDVVGLGGMGVGSALAEGLIRLCVSGLVDFG